MCAPSMPRGGRTWRAWSWSRAMFTRMPPAAGSRLQSPARGEGSGRPGARRSFHEKLSFFGSRLETARAVAGNRQALAEAIRTEQRAGAQLILLAGSRSMDPQDPVLQALEVVGARMERHGVPAYPGTLLWIAYLGDIPVLGAPSCGIFSRATSLDVVLPRLMAGDRMDAAGIAALSSGGIIAPETSYRLPPYRKGVPRGQLE